MSASATSRRESALRFGLVLTLTAVAGAAVGLHLSGINGPSYWQWEWRRLPGTRTFATTVLCILPILAAQVGWHTRRLGRHGALALTALSVLLLQLGYSGINTPTFDLTRIWKIIVDPAATSYFTDAARLVDHRSILESYPELLEGRLTFHSITKPPGPVLFFVALIRWFGLNQGAALAGAFVLALLAALAVPAAYFLFRSFGAHEHAALHGSAALALCTGPIVFFPEFDQAYVVITCLVLGCWCLALKHDRLRFSLLSGAAFSLGLFFVYHLLVLGVFLAGSALLWLDQDRSLDTIKSIAKHGLASLSVFVASNVALWALFGFDCVATFAAAVSNQEMMKSKFAEAGARLYPATIVPDFIDFALGASWLPVLLAPLFMVMLHRRRGGDRVVGLGWASLLQVVVVVISGQIAVETARVLIFLLPLVLFPIALELERWSLPERLVFFGSMSLLTALNFQNMVFLSV